MPDASQFTQIKRLQTSAGADQSAAPNKFRAPRFYNGWNAGQLTKFSLNALLSNKFIQPSVPSVPSVDTIITILDEDSFITVDIESNFTYTLSTNQNDTITVRLYDNGTTNTPINENATEVGQISQVYQITPSENISGSIPSSIGVEGHYYFIRITPENGPVVTSDLYLAISAP